MPLEACCLYASIGTRFAQLEAFRRRASSGTGQVPRKVCLRASSGTSRVPLEAYRLRASSGSDELALEACRLK